MKLGRVHLMGSSYGGMLAIAYALKYQENLSSLITTGGLASVPLTFVEMNRMKSRLPRDVVETLDKYEKAGDYDDPEYVKAAMVFYQRHVCRLKEWPDEVNHTLEHISRP